MPEFSGLYDEEYIKEWIKLAESNGSMTREHMDGLAEIAFGIRW